MSQLIEMLPLSSEELEGVTPDMTNRVIRQYKNVSMQRGWEALEANLVGPFKDLLLPDIGLFIFS